MLPPETVLAYVTEELEGLQAYAARHGWKVCWVPEDLVLTLQTEHQRCGLLRLQAEVDSYKAIPPAWKFVSPVDGSEGRQYFPKRGKRPKGSSIFHPHGFICAPFNRLAYREHGGAHDNWGGPAAWLSVKGTVQATTLADMLSVIDLHLKTSPGVG